MITHNGKTKRIDINVQNDLFCKRNISSIKANKLSPDAVINYDETSLQFFSPLIISSRQRSKKNEFVRSQKAL